jgi:hypothetical protein
VERKSSGAVAVGMVSPGVGLTRLVDGVRLDDTRLLGSIVEAGVIIDYDGIVVCRVNCDDSTTENGRKKETIGGHINEINCEMIQGNLSQRVVYGVECCLTRLIHYSACSLFATDAERLILSRTPETESRKP